MEAFTSDASSATSVVKVGSTFRVTHRYRPAPQTPNLYEIQVTVENLTLNAVDLRYRRVMDWDIEPTPFNEHVTITGTVGNPRVLYASNHGFASADPLALRGDLGSVGDFTDAGPQDHGALFDFGFGRLPAGGTRTFVLYYGATANESAALAALEATSTQTYSLGQTSTDPIGGTPNTFIFGLGPSGHDVNITVSNGPGVVVTAVRATGPAGTGEFKVQLADANGSTQFVLGDGSWILHARNIADLGPAVPGTGGASFFLPVAPLPDTSRALQTNGVANLNRVGILYHPSAPGNSVPLTPANYLQRVQSPLVLAGGTSVHEINLTFGTGGTVQCALLDENGNPASVSGIENVFTVFPFQAGDVLPPLPAGAPGANLQRGLLLGVGTLSSTGGCEISGVPSTTGFTQPAVLETNNVTINTASGPQQVIFVESFQSTGQAGSPTTVNLVAQPARSFVDYISDPYGDGTAQGDIGLVSYGWTGASGAPTNTFAVGATHRGNGTFTLEVIYEGPWIGPDDLDPDRNPPLVRRRTINARAVWDAVERRFRLLEVTGIARSRVTVSGFAEVQGTGQVGTVNWKVDLPGVARVELRVLAGAPTPVDFAPNSGYRLALKSATGHSWNVMD